MRRSFQLAWCTVGCAVVLGLSIWGIMWGSKQMDAKEKDDEARANYGGTTCVVLNMTMVDGDCSIVRVQHYLYSDETTRLQWSYPDERNVTACDKTFSFGVGDRISCYADRAFIRVFLHEGSRPPEGGGGAFAVSLFAACFAFAGLVITPVAAHEHWREEREQARRRRPPPIPNPVHQPHNANNDEGYIDN